jgi:hypothetical protein
VNDEQAAIELIKDLIYATTQATHRLNKTNAKRERKAAAAILKELLGRKPTEEEITEAVSD